jgi:hypothetical protein
LKWIILVIESLWALIVENILLKYKIMITFKGILYLNFASSSKPTKEQGIKLLHDLINL